jgi:hypothetical protein
MTEPGKNERLHALHGLLGNLEHLIAAATDALGRSVSNELIFICDLSIIWTRGTGKKAGLSGAGNFDNPRSRFGRFVKHAISILPPTLAAKFKTGFTGKLRQSAAFGPQSHFAAGSDLFH